MNCIIVKSEMVVLIRREKTVVDMVIGCKLQSITGVVVSERERKN
jgi:hypothetical protein